MLVLLSNVKEACKDKTFGLKNKKGAKFIQQVEKQVKSGGIHPAKPVEDKKKEREEKLKRQAELAALFKPVQTQKVEKGTDPKSVVCAFFKQGQCAKGDRCKFSHDLTIERKERQPITMLKSHLEYKNHKRCLLTPVEDKHCSRKKEMIASKLANIKHVKEVMARKQDSTVDNWKAGTVKALDKEQSGTDNNRVAQFGLKLKDRLDDITPIFDEGED